MLLLELGFTTSYLGNTVEESIWAPTAMMMTIALIPLMKRADPLLRRRLIVVTVGGATYVAFMVLCDGPMYFTRWQADTVLVRETFGFMDGVRDLVSRWVVTGGYADWHDETPWMTGHGRAVRSAHSTRRVSGDTTASLMLVRVERLMRLLARSELNIETRLDAERYVASVMTETAAWSERAPRSEQERTVASLVVARGVELVRLLRVHGSDRASEERYFLS